MLGLACATCPVLHGLRKLDCTALGACTETTRQWRTVQSCTASQHKRKPDSVPLHTYSPRMVLSTSVQWGLQRGQAVSLQHADPTVLLPAHANANNKTVNTK